MANLTSVNLNSIDFTLNDQGRVSINDTSQNLVSFTITDFVEAFDELMTAYRTQMIQMVAFRADNLTAIDLVLEPGKLIEIGKDAPVITEEGLDVLVNMVRESIKNQNTPMLEEISRLLPAEDSISSLADAPDVEVARAALLNALTVMLTKHTGKAHVAEPKPATVEEPSVNSREITETTGGSAVGETSTSGSAESEGGGETEPSDVNIVQSANDSVPPASDQVVPETSEGSADTSVLPADSSGTNGNEAEASTSEDDNGQDSQAGGVQTDDEVVDGSPEEDVGIEGMSK